LLGRFSGPVIQVANFWTDFLPYPMLKLCYTFDDVAKKFILTSTCLNEVVSEIVIDIHLDELVVMMIEWYILKHLSLAQVWV
jgi:hypothetical protein